MEIELSLAVAVGPLLVLGPAVVVVSGALPVGLCVRGSPVGSVPDVGPVGVGAPSGPIASAGNPGGGGISPPAIGAAAGMIRIPAAAATHSGQNLGFISPLYVKVSCTCGTHQIGNIVGPD